MQDRDHLGLKSPFAQELTNNMPRPFIRYGAYYLVLTLALILILSLVVKNNEIVAGNILLNSDPPVNTVYATHDLQVDTLFLKEGDMAVEGQLIGTFNSTADYRDVEALKERLNIDLNSIPLDSLSAVFPQNLSLGQVLQSYHDFYLVLQRFILFKQLNTVEQKKESAEREIGFQRDLLMKRKIELSNLRSRLRLANDKLDRKTTLFKKGVISKAELEDQQSDNLELRGDYEKFKSEIDRAEIDLSLMESKFSNANYDFLENQGANLEILNKSKAELLSSIVEWEDIYTIRSPITGRVSFFDIFSKGDAIKSQQPICSVSPGSFSSFIGKIRIPVENSGKVKKNQRVIIKLSSLPFEQFGYVEGRITGTANVPETQTRTILAYCRVDKTTTNTGHEISYREKLLGSAEIVTEELSLFQRVFYKLRRNVAGNQ